ncbi:unnamed protein product [Rhizophagus irregularis]|nr:unnamed protein product [Rhizophagus irregularis]
MGRGVDAELLEGGFTLEERRTNYTNQTLVKGSWTTNTRNYAETLLNISVSYAEAIPKLYRKVSPFHKVSAGNLMCDVNRRILDLATKIKSNFRN